MNVDKKIKLIIFDLDGVLVDAKLIHYYSLNQALDEQYAIKWEEHLSIYDGLKTNQKLEMLSVNKGLPRDQHQNIWNEKQRITIKMLQQLTPDENLKITLHLLSSAGYMLAVCSNSIRKTIFTVLAKLDISQYFDLILSNEDVVNSKPHPELYWKAMSTLKVLPEETLIIEDSPYGLLAAYRSKAEVLRIGNPTEISYNTIMNKINQPTASATSPKWTDTKLNVLIPMAGAGSRFAQAGYTFPKPLIEVHNKPMIQLVVENLNIEANYIFVVQKEHRDKYNLDTMLNLIAPGCTIVEVTEMTQGAACTTLLAEQYIDNDNPLFFANSDQFVSWDSNEFMYRMNENNFDGGIVTFKATHPKWSFAKLDENGLVTEVAEKNPISDNATVGFYYWKHGSDYVKYAKQMIDKDIRVNGEFYVCPVFNEAILDNKKIISHHVDGMWGLGTPEDLDFFIKKQL